MPVMSKPSLPQGTRDFGPEVVRKRNFIIHTIKTVFELYGFQPLETPAMENLDTLLGKYGDEGDKLIFKILNNGLNDPRNIDKAKKAFENLLNGRNDKDLTERALKYDLTIPFARYVAMNYGQLAMPFKRYQVQPVWRADRPQKGRYREFYQCDADVVGSGSLLNEVELINIYAAVFTQLGISVNIKLNNRKILAALADISGGAEKLTAITVAIDKLDKIGIEKVEAELAAGGLLAEQVSTIKTYLQIEGDNAQKLEAIKALFKENLLAAKGIAELEYLLQFQDEKIGKARMSIDLTLARGLNYYTGTIFEIKALEATMGSIGGGGRYDDLTGLFGVPGVPGVGISFGLDRIYDVMEELALFPGDVYAGTKLLFFNLGADESKRAFLLMQFLRARGIACELYPEQAKFDKQFKYAERKRIAYALMIGSRELAEQTCTVKNLVSGEQQTVPWTELETYPF